MDRKFVYYKTNYKIQIISSLKPVTGHTVIKDQ